MSDKVLIKYAFTVGKNEMKDEMRVPVAWDIKSIANAIHYEHPVLRGKLLRIVVVHEDMIGTEETYHFQGDSMLDQSDTEWRLRNNYGVAKCPLCKHMRPQWCKNFNSEGHQTMINLPICMVCAGEITDHMNKLRED